MQRLDELYEKAIQQAKNRVLEEIDRYFYALISPPTFEEFLDDRTKFIEQLWLNYWLNITNSDVPRKEKKRYLLEKGYAVEGIDKKKLNKLFQQEMKTFPIFDLLSWIKGHYSEDEEKWNKTFYDAKEMFVKQEAANKLRAKKQKILSEIEEISAQTIQHDYELFYLYVRNFISKKVCNDISKSIKYQNIEPHKIEQKLVEQGKFDTTKYSTLDVFFQELTGAVHKTIQWEYETYRFAYKKSVGIYLEKLVTNWILEKIPSALINQFFDTTNIHLTEKRLAELIGDYLYGLNMDFFSQMEGEFLDDLLEVAFTPFDVERHRQLFKKHQDDRERKKAKELADIEREKQRELLMLEDIFGREYSPSLGRDIRYILHIGETNTGKTYHALKAMVKAETGLYLAPLRLLALEVYDKLSKDGVNCGLRTGEEEKDVEGASHLSCTVEMFYEKSYFDVIVIDEAQMIADRDRGFSWYKAITKANAKEVHIIGSHNSREMVINLLGNSEIEIYEYYRETPLIVEKREFKLKDTTRGDALVCFSRRKVLETASRLENNGFSVSIIYGSMPPETRKKQMERFIKKETAVIVATDAIGMGLNLPIRRIVFLENEKFDGNRRRRLTSQEIKQIAGRAGRKGIYNEGRVAFTSDIKMMQRLLHQEDMLISTFSIAPTSKVFDRFQKYYRDMGKFFELWYKFESPFGTKKASLAEERELYATIRGSEVEARLSIKDLYGFLHMPFSKNDNELIKQWRETMFAIVQEKQLPEPQIKKDTLENLELSYKALGLHLLFLYRLNRGTEAIYWERARQEISDYVHQRLQTDVKNYTKKCKSCMEILPEDFVFTICNRCHARKRNRNEDE